MKCAQCKRDISTSESLKMVTVFKYPDGHDEVTIPSEGLKATPGGKILKAFHYKHYKVNQKVERRLADEGSLIGKAGMPTAYEIGAMVLTRDEMLERGLTMEEAAELTTRPMSDYSNEILKIHIDKFKDRQAARARQAEVDRKAEEAELAAKDAKLKKWPAGGQLDMEF